MPAQGIHPKLRRANSVLADVLKLQRRDCYYCDRPAQPSLALEIALHDPKSVVWKNYKTKQWVAKVIEVPRCEQCYDIDQGRGRSTSWIVVAALIGGAIGLASGILTFDIHESDALPVILAALGLVLPILFFAPRVRARVAEKGSYRKRTNPEVHYEPVKHLLDAGWKHVALPHAIVG